MHEKSADHSRDWLDEKYMEIFLKWFCHSSVECATVLATTTMTQTSHGRDDNVEQQIWRDFYRKSIPIRLDFSFIRFANTNWIYFLGHAKWHQPMNKTKYVRFRQYNNLGCRSTLAASLAVAWNNENVCTHTRTPRHGHTHTHMHTRAKPKPFHIFYAFIRL